MIKIQSLLNPIPDPQRLPSFSLLSRPPTPAYTNQSTPSPAPAPSTPYTPMTPNSSGVRPKLAKDAPSFYRGPVKGDVNYAPYECSERPSCLTSSEKHDLRDQHNRFRISPSGGVCSTSNQDGLIVDYVQHIPYNSEKKSFFGKTGRDGFEGTCVVYLDETNQN